MGGGSSPKQANTCWINIDPLKLTSYSPAATPVSRATLTSQILTSEVKEATAMKRPSAETSNSWLPRLLGSRTASSLP